MAGSKHKKVVQKENPKGRHIEQRENPNAYYSKRPAWNFNSCDNDKWPIDQAHVGDLIWNTIFPYLKGLETKTWQEILVKDNKQNHSIDIKRLNACAQTRLIERYIEYESITSLRG